MEPSEVVRRKTVIRWRFRHDTARQPAVWYFGAIPLQEYPREDVSKSKYLTVGGCFDSRGPLPFTDRRLTELLQLVSVSPWRN